MNDIKFIQGHTRGTFKAHINHFLRSPGRDVIQWQFEVSNRSLDMMIEYHDTGISSLPVSQMQLIVSDNRFTFAHRLRKFFTRSDNEIEDWQFEKWNGHRIALIEYQAN